MVIETDDGRAGAGITTDFARQPGTALEQLAARRLSSPIAWSRGLPVVPTLVMLAQSTLFDGHEASAEQSSRARLEGIPP
jgi:hypothetical protein